MANGNLVFPPFRAEDYRQDVHAQAYACLAKNQVGSIISRDVNVRAGELVFDRQWRHRISLFRQEVLSNGFRPRLWTTLKLIENYRSVVVTQYYEADVNKEHVIRGNSAVMKCLIPSFVADFVEVVSWHTDENDTYFARNDMGSSPLLRHW